MPGTRETVVAALAQAILSSRPSRPLRVAVDGRTASGKTTLADELAAAIQRLGQPVIRTSIDGFHRPKAERYARGRYSAQGYYHDARAFDAIVDLLLKPLGPDGDRHYCTASFDLAADVPLPLDFTIADPRAVLIVDGTFLQRPALRAWWDYVVFVDVDELVAQSRGIARDAVQLGDEQLAARLFAERYRPAYRLYTQEVDPIAQADAVLGNRDFESPTLRFGEPARL